MASRARLVAGGLALAAWVLAASALAEPSAADRETARTLMDEGDRLIEGGDASGALKAYKAAHALMGVPTTGLEVGKAEAALGQLVEARDTLLAVSRMPSVPREPAAFAKARQEASALAEQLAKRLSTIVVVVKGGEGEARVEVDGAVIPPAALALPRKVNPGAHVVRASAKGLVDARAEVTLAEGEQREITLTLSAPQEAAAPPLVAAPEAPRPPPGKARPVLVYGGFGLAGVGVVTGIVTGLMSSSKTTELEAQCTVKVCPPSAQPTLDGARSLATVSNVSFGVGALGAVAGLVGLLAFSSSAPSSATPPSAALWLSPGPSSRSVGLAGRF